MTWAELEQLLPNGFHDARLDKVKIDYRGRIAVLEFEFWAVTEWPERKHAIMPELYRRGRVTFLDLLACAVDVPNGEYQIPDASELWINVAPGEDSLPKHSSWPKEPLPAGAFVRSFYFLNDAASFVHVSARSVDFEWLSEIRLLSEAVAEQPAI